MPLVPDVLDEITALAQRKLEAVGLKVGTISTEKNPGGIPGTVLRTSPDLGSSVPEGSAVDLVIIFRRPAAAPMHVREAAAKRVDAVWLPLGVWSGEAEEEAG